MGGGYYTAGGGTSGASCLAGGLGALVQRARRRQGKAPLSGPQMKALLIESASRGVVVAPGARPLTPDPMNCDDEIFMEASYFFGAGLPDAALLLSKAEALP